MDELETTEEHLNLSSSRVDDVALRPNRAPTLALLTNRNHLSEFLACGFVKPAAAIPDEQYYDDLGTRELSVLPLLAQDPSPEMAQYVNRASNTAYPVLIDVEMGERAGSRIIRSDFSVAASGKLDGAIVVEALPGVIPLSAIRAAHFRSDDELREFTLRTYADVRPDAIQLAASPERFRGPTLDLERLGTALTEAGADAAPISASRLKHLSALSGALLLVGHLAPVLASMKLNVLAAALSRMMLPASDSHREIGRPIDVTGSERWIALLPEMLLDERNTVPDLLVRAEHPSAELLGGVLFTESIRHLASTSPDEFYAAGALSAIRTRFEQEVRQLSEVHASDVNGYVRLLDLAEQIVQNNADLGSFPTSAAPAVTGLLYFLNRPTPERVVRWASEQPVTDSSSVVLACALAGALHGREGVPVDLRPGPAFERLLDDLSSQIINREAGGMTVAIPRDDLLVNTSSGADNVTIESLTGPFGELIRRELPSPAESIAPSTGKRPESKSTQRKRTPRVPRAPKTTSETPLPFAEPQTGPRAPDVTEPVGVRIADLRADPVQVIQRLLSGTEGGPAVRRAVLHLCRVSGWEDCVVTRVPLEGRAFQLVQAPDRPLSIVISGFAGSRTEIRPERLKERLTAEAWNALPTELQAAVVAILDGDQTTTGSGSG